MERVEHSPYSKGVRLSAGWCCPVLVRHQLTFYDPFVAGHVDEGAVVAADGVLGVEALSLVELEVSVESPGGGQKTGVRCEIAVECVCGGDAGFRIGVSNGEF